MNSTFLELSLIKPYNSLLDALKDISQLSKSQIKKFYKRPSQLNAKIRAKTTIKVPINLLNFLKVNPIYSGPKVNILFEDEEFLVLEKPAKVHTHPLSYEDENNLVSFVVESNPALDRVNNQHYDRGFIYRLDYETSGVIYYAKNNDVYNEIRSNFSTIVIQKNYIAIVCGIINKEQKFKHYHYQKSGADRVVISNESNGDEVSLDIVPIDFNAQRCQSLIAVKLSEGKRHQIRAQLSYEGYPICGDELYSGDKSERVYLHCFQYIFKFKNKQYSLESHVNWEFPLP